MQQSIKRSSIIVGFQDSIETPWFNLPVLAFSTDPKVTDTCIIFD